MQGSSRRGCSPDLSAITARAEARTKVEAARQEISDLRQENEALRKQAEEREIELRRIRAWGNDCLQEWIWQGHVERTTASALGETWEALTGMMQKRDAAEAETEQVLVRVARKLLRG